MTGSESSKTPEGPARLEVFVSIATVLAGAFLIYGGLQLPVVSRGNLSTGPGPGLFPIAVASLLVALAIWQTASLLRRGAWDDNGSEIPARVVYIVFTYAIAIALLDAVGFFVDMTIMVGTLMVLFGERNKWFVVGISIFAALVATLIFGEVFSVRLPSLGIPVGPWTL